jgi:hypothetical protein
MSTHRTVREEKPFQTTIDRLRGTYSRIDEVWEAICWDLCRDPVRGAALSSDSRFRITETDSYVSAMPSFWVLFSYDDDMVYLWGLAPVPEDSSDE